MSEARAKSRVVPFEFRTFAGIGAFFVLLGTIYVVHVLRARRHHHAVVRAPG
jgi:hypothetical protein